MTGMGEEPSILTQGTVAVPLSCEDMDAVEWYLVCDLAYDARVWELTSPLVAKTSGEAREALEKAGLEGTTLQLTPQEWLTLKLVCENAGWQPSHTVTVRQQRIFQRLYGELQELEFAVQVIHACEEKER